MYVANGYQKFTPGRGVSDVLHDFSAPGRLQEDEAARWAGQEASRR